MYSENSEICIRGYIAPYFKNIKNTFKTFKKFFTFSLE